MPPDAPAVAERADALLAGYLGGVVAAFGPEAGRLALDAAGIAGEELLLPEPSLESLARRWAGLAGAAALDAGAAAGLAHLAAGRGPRTAAASGEEATLPVLLPPVALLTFDSPRNLLSASYHIAALTHPIEESRWAAVAVNVALARFLQGYRDIVPDLIEALRNNDAPAPLLSLARRLPLLSQGEIQALPGDYSPAVSDAITALWLAHREPVAARGISFVAARPDLRGRSAVSALSALFGARDASIENGPPLALPAPAADIRALALRLARVPTNR
jgi:hypothetical protein